MINLIMIAVVVLIAALLVYASTRPDTFRVQRTASIKTAPELIFPFINDFHKWGSWSPYEKKDLAMKKNYSGAATGKGSAYEWEGNNEVGKGRIEIMETSPPSMILLKLDMIKPMAGHNIVEFSLEPNGDFTDVTWGMRGSSPFLSKVMGLFINMDHMIGKDFEAGLANLKTVAEK